MRDSEMFGFPQSLAIALGQTARVVAAGHPQLLVGDGVTRNYRALVEQWRPQAVAYLTESVELITNNQFTLRAADHSLLREYRFPADPLLLLVRCRFGWAEGVVISDPAPTDLVYVITAPEGECEGITVRHLA